MKWTTVADIRSQLQKLWDKGLLLPPLADGETIFPRRLTLKGPGSSEMAEHFAEVRSWISDLSRETQRYRLEWRTINHRTLGNNSVPAEIWIDTLENALALIGKQREAEKFASLVAISRVAQPRLIPWLAKRPLRSLALADSWQRLLDVVTWLQHHPRPDIYLRQVDIPGVHSKFIEQYRAVLTELFDLVLPPEAIEQNASGLSGFCRRYGFLDKPSRVRFRFLDASLSLFAGDTDRDFTVTTDTFGKLNPEVDTVFITENEINFLAFPAVTKSMVIFGSGYGFEMLSQAAWLQTCTIYYWGDIDTHGFAILDQLRAHLPTAASLLMDRETLLTHRLHWDREPQPKSRELIRLTEEEKQLYNDLRSNRLDQQLRLEQERIGFSWVMEYIDKVTSP